MKYKLGLLFLLFPICAWAQTNVVADSLAKIVLNDLVASWTLGIDSNSDAVDIRIYNKFKSLFNINATIDDDFNAFYQYDRKKKSGFYKIRTEDNPKTFDVYAHDVALQIRSIIIDNVARLDSNTNDPKNMSFTIAMKVHVQKTRQYVLPGNYADEVINSRNIEFEDKKDSISMAANLKTKIGENREAIYEFTSVDTMRITMALEEDTVVRIRSIKSIKSMYEIICTNDEDLDAVLNKEDSVQHTFGDFTTYGRPDDDLDGVPDKYDKCKFTYGKSNNQGCPRSYFITKNEFDGFIGFQFNSAKINLPELNQLGYLDASGKDAMDVLQSKKGSLKNPGQLPGIYAGGSFTYYFGQKRKRKGISIGFTYSGITAEYLLDAPIVYTFKSNDGVNFYRRQITIGMLKEEIQYSILNVPVLFNYRTHLDSSHKLVLNLKIGPSLMIFNNTSSYDATIDFGGLYQIDPVRRNAIIYDDYFDQASRYNIFFTSNAINTQNPDPGANSVFEQLNSKTYDFANNKNYSGKQELHRITVAFNLNVDFQYKVSEGLTIKAGPHIVYAPLFESKEKYKPIDKTTDEYQSIYKSNAKSSYSAYGGNIGFVYNF